MKLYRIDKRRQAMLILGASYAGVQACPVGPASDDGLTSYPLGPHSGSSRRWQGECCTGNSRLVLSTLHMPTHPRPCAQSHLFLTSSHLDSQHTCTFLPVMSFPMLCWLRVQISITSPDDPALLDIYLKFDASANDAEFTTVGVTKYVDPFFPPVSIASTFGLVCHVALFTRMVCIFHALRLRWSAAPLCCIFSICSNHACMAPGICTITSAC